MLALAVAGINQIEGSDPATEAVLGADTTRHVQVPLDVAWSYVWRAKKAAGTIPGPRRLAWLERQDVEERTHWVAEFRDGTDTLGAIVKRLMVTRDAHWSPVEAPKSDTQAHVPERTATPKVDKGKHDAPARASSQQQDTKLSLMNGEKLCPAFQKGACAVVTSTNGRVCGKGDHGANNHREEVKGKGKR